jgi:tetratricopeptide (TPR) repeat protein
MVWIILIFLIVLYIYSNQQKNHWEQQTSTKAEHIHRVRENDLATLDRLVQNDPENLSPGLWIQRSDFLQKLNRNEEALANYEEALRYYPDHPQILQEQGFVLATLGKFEAALEHYQQAGGSIVNKLENWHTRGDALLELGRYEEAIACLQEALKYKPYYADHLWADTGYALLQLGRLKEAQAALKKSIKLKDSAYACYWYGQTFIDLGQSEDALQFYLQAAKRFPNDEQLWGRMMFLLLQLRTNAEVQEECDHFPRLHPKQFKALYVKALLPLREQQWESALDFLASLQVKKLSVQWLIVRVVLHWKEKQYESVLQDCQIILQQQPLHRPALEYSAQASEAQENYIDALEKYQLLLTHYPDMYWVRIRLGLLLGKLNRHQEALNNFEMVLRQRPEDTDVLYLKALTLLDLGDSVQALETAQQLLELNPDHQGTIALHTIQTAIALDA